MDLHHTVDEIAALVNGRVRGAGDRPLSGLRSLEHAGSTELAAVFRAEYAAAAAECTAGALLVPPELDLPESADRSLIVVDDPEQALDLVVERLGPPSGDPPPGVHPTAVVEADARVDPTASVGALAYVGSGAVVGPRTRIWARVFIGQDATVGEDCRLYPGVYVGARCRLGKRVIIQPNAVIGGDGFGYRPDSEGRFIKSPQVGHVVLADDVEIGSCSTVDRARLETTRVERGAKLDSLVHVAHNCVVGEDSAVAALSGLAGRASLGRHVQIAGHSGVNSGTHVADGCIVGGMTGIMKDTRPGEFLVGYPPLPKREWTRLHLSLRKLPGMLADRRGNGAGDGTERRKR